MSLGYNIIDSFKVQNLFNWICEFRLPLNYSIPEKGTIKVVARITQLAKNVTPEPTTTGPVINNNDKVIVYLQGGPGFPTETPLSNDGLAGYLLEKGYTLINLDQRGTGLSTALGYKTIIQVGENLGYGSDIDGNVDKYLDLIKCFRADSIVNDCEEIRKILFKHDLSRKWSIIGQSYGGFCSNTYVSLYPDSLVEVLMTGGIPGIGRSVDDLYKATYKSTSQRNSHYYSKYPQDVKKVKNILKYLHMNKVVLPNGGILSVERFQQLGMKFGVSGGTDQIHQLVFKFNNELNTFGFPTYTSLKEVQDSVAFDTNIIYALFHEAIYLDGPGSSSNWAAERRRYDPEHRHLFDFKQHLGSLQNGDWLNDETAPVYFTGEMVFKSTFDDYTELRKLKKLAYKIHEHDGWGHLYRPETLHKIYDSLASYRQKSVLLPSNSPKNVSEDEVKVLKVAAVLYYNDNYVDFGLSKHTVENQYGSIRTHVTSEFLHNGISADTKQVMDRLFSLLEKEVD